MERLPGVVLLDAADAVVEVGAAQPRLGPRHVEALLVQSALLVVEEVFAVEQPVGIVKPFVHMAVAVVGGVFTVEAAAGIVERVDGPEISLPTQFARRVEIPEFTAGKRIGRIAGNAQIVGKKAVAGGDSVAVVVE